VCCTHSNRNNKIGEFHTDKYGRGAMVNFPNITNKKLMRCEASGLTHEADGAVENILEPNMKWQISFYI